MFKKKIGKLIWIIVFVFSCARKTNNAEVTIRISQDPESLNAVQYTNASAAQIINLLYQGLLTVDHQSKEFKPLLASEMPQVNVKDDSSSYTFNLRPEATWSNGKPVLAEDVVFTLKLIKCEAFKSDRLRSALEFIKDIKTYPADRKKITFICGTYIPDDILQIGDFAILPEFLVDPKGSLRNFSLKTLARHDDSLSNHPEISEVAARFNSNRFTHDKTFLQGSGGYNLDAWKTGQYVQLKKKQNWWGDQLKPASSYITARPQRITFQVIPDNNTALLTLKSEQLDVYAGIPFKAYEQLAADKNFKQKYNLFAPATYDFTYLGINGRLKKFADVRTRQALAHLFEVNKIIQVTQGGLATRTIGPIIPANTPFYNKALTPYNFDLNKATVLLQAAGWVKDQGGWQKQLDGQWVPLTITLSYKTGDTEFENIALIFKQAAAGLNIPVTIQAMEGLLFKKALKEHNFEMFIRSLSGNPFVYNFKPILHTASAEAAGNYTNFGTPESDKLIDEINQTQELETKAILLKRLQAILHEQSNLIFLYFVKDRMAIHKRFTDLKVSGIKPGYDVSSFKLKAE